VHNGRLWQRRLVLTRGYASPDNSRANASLDEQLRTERSVAVGRTLVAACTLTILLISAPASRGSVASALLAGWLVLAFVVLVRLRLDPRRRATLALPVHVVDVLVAVAVTLLTSGSTTPSFALLLFALLAAAYRWGFVGAMSTACASGVLLALEPMLAGAMPQAATVRRMAYGDVFVRSAYLLLAGMVTGYLAQSEKRFRSEAVSIAAIMGRADVRVGLKRTMAAVFDAIFPLFDARRAVLVIAENATDHVFVWSAERAAKGTLPAIDTSRLEPDELPTYMFAPAAAAWHAAKRRGTPDRWDVVAIDREGSRVDSKSWTFPSGFLAAMQPGDRLMAVGVDLGNDWTGRLFLVDPIGGPDLQSALVFAQRVVRQVAPAVHNVYLLQRVKAKASAIERARIARELHDGVIQTVTGVQIQVAAMSLKLSRESSPTVVSELRRLDLVLQQEVIRTRELMTQMKPLDVGPDELVDVLADFVQRFQRETGIAARFVTQLDRIALAPHACREIARIVQEALVNVRRHSGARNVFVRLSTEDGDCRLSIDDDGCGFGFRGRMTQAELTAARKGPQVIDERVRLLGGALTVESDPSRGARLEIAVPLSPHVINS
jgi:signal transduction histidine kinase